MTRFIPALGEALYKGFFTIRRCDVMRVADDGTAVHFKRELFERGHAAAALIHDPVEDKVLLIKEFRVGNFGARMPQDLWDDVGPVAGMIEGDDTAYDTIIREITEESGLDASSFSVVATMTVLPSPGGSSETITLVLMRGDLKGVENAEFGVAGEAEFTVREIWDRKDAVEILGRRGPINGNLATLLLMMERERFSEGFKNFTDAEV